MNVLITGGTGFIGSRLALRCLERGETVNVLGQENSPAEVENRKLVESAGATAIVAPVTDKDRVTDSLKGIDIVYHLAAAQHEANVPDQHFWDVNVTGTRNILEASVSAGVKQFVHGSTIGVYGSGLEGTLDESSELRPDNIYGVTKLEAEKLALSFADRLPVVVIRISETYGPGDHRLLRLFKAIEKNRFFMIGSGENLHHPIFVDDLIDGLFLASSREEAVGKVFVLAGKESVTTNEMVEAIASQLGRRMPSFRAPMFPLLVTANIMGKALAPIGIQPPLHPRRMDFFRKSFVLSNDAASETLGFTPRRSFCEGVRETAEWYRQTGYLPGPSGVSGNGARPAALEIAAAYRERNATTTTGRKLTAKMEPFDSYWEGPEDIEKGYRTLAQFYRSNYLKHLPQDRPASVLVVSCGPGYFVNLLASEGYTNVIGIDSDREKVEHATARGLNCIVAEAFPFLEEHPERFDLIFCESEINHLTKEEILEFLELCRNSLKQSGTLIFHSMNGANPITGAEGLALNIDHYNTFTEYSMRQILEYTGFGHTDVIPLKLYVFYKNPLNYVGIVLETVVTLLFRFAFIFYGKSNKLFTKKIAAIAHKGSS